MVYVENNNLLGVISSAAVGETVVLNNDIVLEERVTISKEIILDLNGHSIVGNLEDDYGAIYVGTKGNLTIIDNSESKNGGISNNLGNAIGNYGIANIYAGTITGNYALYNFHYSDTIYGTSAIYGGVFKGIGEEKLAIANGGDLTIEGGEIESLDSTSVLSVNGGTIQTLNISVADYSPVKESTTIKGGIINTLTTAENTNNDISISGGTFKCAVNKAFLTDGFRISYNPNSNSYEVIVDNSLKVIVTTSEKIDSLPIKNGQLVFIPDSKEVILDFNNQRTKYAYDKENIVEEANKYTDNVIMEALTIMEF